MKLFPCTNKIVMISRQSNNVTLDFELLGNMLSKKYKIIYLCKTLDGGIRSKISVKIKTQDTYVYGILSRYDATNNTYIIEGISHATKIENGSIVTTTGMGDIFPAGIVIGKVTGVTTDSFDLSNVLEVKSDVNFDSIDFVTILKRNI